MPLITIESGKLTKEQKSELIAEITKITSKIINAPENLCFVSINELSDENIGVGGQTVEELKKNINQRNNK